MRSTNPCHSPSIPSSSYVDRPSCHLGNSASHFGKASLHIPPPSSRINQAVIALTGQRHRISNNPSSHFNAPSSKNNYIVIPYPHTVKHQLSNRQTIMIHVTN